METEARSSSMVCGTPFSFIGCWEAEYFNCPRVFFGGG